MPEATVLYTVTAVVVLGLIVWVAAVLKTAREPWARPHGPRHSGVESLPPVGSEGQPSRDAEDAEAAADAAKLDADSTAKATPVALASEAKTLSSTDDDAKA